MSELKDKNILEPNNAKVWYRKGIELFNLGQLSESVRCYKQAIKLAPSYKEAFNNLGMVLLLSGNYDEALYYLKIVANKYPSYKDPYINMGIIFEIQNHKDRAKKCYQKALEIDPYSLESNVNLGKIYEFDFELDKAQARYSNAIQKFPYDSKLHIHMGDIYHKKMELEKSFEHYQIAMKCDPKNIIAKFRFNLTLPIIYRTKEEIIRYRRRYAKGLFQIIKIMRQNASEEKIFYLEALKNFTPFFLQYQCKNDIGLQKKYGEFVHRVITANFPQYNKKLDMPPLKEGERLRIGYVSSYMQSHSVGKFIIGWLRKHDKKRFAVHSYYINSKQDSLTDDFIKVSDAFYYIPNDLKKMADSILKDNLHILIFTDIGMYPLATMLAGLRLAPVQCTTWGHPVTTGLPTMDYFLSSELMEPANAQFQYSEKLIRLPNLSLSQKPDTLPQNAENRADFGLPENRFIFLSTQSLYKYLPQYDFVFPKIAVKAPHSFFTFIGHENLYITDAFKKRISTAFKRHGVEYEKYCKITPRLGKSEFLSLNSCANVLLDSLGWSGCNSTLEAISSCQTPVVTFKGKFMRGRHTYAMLKMIGLDDTIAKTTDEYINISSKLALNDEFYQMIKNKMRQNSGLLFNDSSCVVELENFFQKVCEEKMLEK